MTLLLERLAWAGGAANCAGRALTVTTLADACTTVMSFLYRGIAIEIWLSRAMGSPQRVPRYDRF